MSLTITWARGGSATVVERTGDRVALHSTISAAPGTPLEGSAEGAPAPLVVKVRRCQRLPEEGSEAAFRIEGRLVNVPRGLRAFLDARFPE